MILRSVESVANLFYNRLSFLNNNYFNLNYRICYEIYSNYKYRSCVNYVRRFMYSTHMSTNVYLGRKSMSRNLRTRVGKFGNDLDEGNGIDPNKSENKKNNLDLSIPSMTTSSSSSTLHSELNPVRVRRDLVYEKGSFRGVHFSDHYKETEKFVPHPFNRRFGYSKRPLFPIEPRNLRIYGLLKHRKRGVGKKSNAKGVRHKHLKKRGRKPNSRTFEGGQTPLYKRLPKYPEAILSKFDKKYDTLNLCKLRYFIERGRLDTRFPITQRHLHDSKCLKVRNGVHLFNVNNYPFPYKIDISVSSCDQSSVDAIRAVGGSVTIIHHNNVSLRAHVKPYKYEILPKTPRPDIKRVHELEKFRLMGCNVVYIKPLWLIKEENRLMEEFKELYQNVSSEDFDQIIVKYRLQMLEEQLKKGENESNGK